MTLPGLSHLGPGQPDVNRPKPFLGPSSRFLYTTLPGSGEVAPAITSDTAGELIIPLKSGAAFKGW